MTDLIRHAAAMTRHREHALVDMALVHSLVELLAANRKRLQVRLFSIAGQAGGGFELSLTAWNEGRTVHHGEQDYSAKDLPHELLEATESQVAVTRAPPAHGNLHLHWLPAVYERAPVACVEIGISRPLTQRQVSQVDGIISLYTNYLSLLRYSQVDTLTQLLNRKTFEDSLDKILLAYEKNNARHGDQERRGESSSSDDWLAIIDIDHFKQVNDRFGHLFGDEVLILLADLMRQTFRRRDKLFRFGGEEFVVILRHASEQRAQQVFERFRLVVGAATFPQLGQVTISAGITRIQAMDSPTILLGRADEALYYAKNHGRNRIAYYEALAKLGKVPTRFANTEAEMF